MHVDHPPSYWRLVTKLQLQLFAETMSFGLRLRERDQREKIEKIRNLVLPSGQSVGVHSVRKTFEVNVP